MTGVSARWGWTEEVARVEVRTALLAFDRVVVHDTEQDRELSSDEFLALPLDQRIRMNFEGKLEFFRGAASVPRSDAMRSLISAARSG